MCMTHRFPALPRFLCTAVVAGLLAATMHTPTAVARPCNYGRNVDSPCLVEDRDAVSVVANGVRLSLSPGAFEEHNYVMAPLRAVLEAMGADVTWNEAEQSETAQLGPNRIKVFMGTTLALINGNEADLPIAPRLIDDRVHAPLRFVAQPLGISVTWDDASRTSFLRYSADPTVRDQVNLVVNGAPLSPTVPAFEESFIVMAPMHDTLERAGAIVDEKAGRATLGEHSVTVQIDGSRAWANGKAFTLLRPTRWIDGVLFVPIRGVAEALGAQVIWDEGTRTEYVDARGAIILMCDTCVGIPGWVEPGHIAMVTLQGALAGYYSFGPRGDDFSIRKVPAEVDTTDIQNAHKLTTQQIVARVNAYRRKAGSKQYNWGFEMTGVAPADAARVKQVADQLKLAAEAGKQLYQFDSFNCLTFVQKAVHEVGIDYQRDSEIVPNNWARALWRHMGYTPLDFPLQ